MRSLQILGISGSLRKDSLNRRALLAVRSVLPEGITLEVEDLHSIPLYNADLDSIPEAVVRFKERIAESDGVLIATPEYNYGIPGVLKNALDWASRPAYASVFANKPVALLGASPGAVGTARAQGQLKQVLLGMISEVFPYPEVNLGNASERLGPEGKILDARTKEQLQKFSTAYFEALSRRRGEGKR